MSMYAAIFGRNPMSTVLLAMLDLKESDVGRFRDCYVAEEDGQPVIAIYTRNGGGNRHCWCSGSEKYGTEGCKHHDIEEMVKEAVELPYDRENPILPEGHTWANIFIGSKRVAYTGRMVPQTYHVCEAPNSPECRCVGCWTNYHAAQLPGYIRDEDDDFDQTYCTFYFRAPEGWRDLLAGMVRKGDPDADWQDFLAALQAPPAEPQTRAQELAVGILEKLGATA